MRTKLKKFKKPSSIGYVETLIQYERNDRTISFVSIGLADQGLSALTSLPPSDSNANSVMSLVGLKEVRPSVVVVYIQTHTKK